MVPTRDKRELLTKGKIVERWYLQETIENREGYYQRQERRELVPTSAETRERVQTRDKRSSSQAKKCNSWKKIEKR